MTYDTPYEKYCIYYRMKIDSYSFVDVKWVENVLTHSIATDTRESFTNIITSL